MSDAKPKTARSYRASVVGDNTIISLNIKWLIQCLVAISAIVYGYFQIENRIGELERGMDDANEKITDLVSKHIAEEDARYLEMEKQLQWYQKDNASVAQGNLVITGRKEKIPNPNFKADATNWKQNRQQAEYTSSSINTRGKFQFKYGILEVRAKIDTASGLWPAIWTLGVEKGWPSNGEIDVMEYYLVDQKPAILANAAWKGETSYISWDSEKIPFSEFLQKDPKWADKYHIWKMDWTADSIKIYLDNQLLNTIDLTTTKNPDGFNPFHQPHYILLNLAIGGNGGDPSNTSFPRKYEVDYVRVYQKK